MHFVTSKYSVLYKHLSKLGYQNCKCLNVSNGTLAEQTTGLISDTDRSRSGAQHEKLGFPAKLVC